MSARDEAEGMGAAEAAAGATGMAFELGREIPPLEQPARLAALELAVRERVALRPVVGLVLGSGLGGLADALDLEVAIPFGDLPGWPDATAPGHAGRLLFGRLSGVPVVVQQGRFHLYEGHSAGLARGPWC
jgi:purine-nucleoside phosphorylase